MQKKRVLYFDVLNILACIAVISLHHNGVVHTYSNSWTWKNSIDRGDRCLLGGAGFSDAVRGHIDELQRKL